MRIDRPRPGKALVSQVVFQTIKATIPTARLEVHSIGRSPTRAEITAALTRAIPGNFTLSLEKPGKECFYVSEIAPANCLNWFQEHCRSYATQGALEASTETRASVYWEDLKVAVGDDY